ncbi:ClpP family protease [Thermoactinospora rubra]|uniref:ClpP family protease n=1 Tax=Thermoactinospora rubra TaxID=1088767 RepID=UPI000A0FA4B7|nr:ATP-dependent Clp protease proteolytic subunit [Thermoactinospora rubra]
MAPGTPGTLGGAPGWPPPEWTPPGWPSPPRPEPEPARRPPVPTYYVPVGPDPVTERLLEQRIVLAYGELTEERVTAWCATILTLGATGRAPIKLHLSIPDGDLGPTLTMLDTLDSLTVEVDALVTGRLGGPPVALLAATTRRRSAPNAIFRLGEPRLTAAGTADDVLAQQEQSRRMLDTIYFRLADLTGREVDELRDDAVKGRTLSAAEAVAYGLVEAVQN